MKKVHKKLFKLARLRLLTFHHDSKSGHIGGNFSCIDALMVLHHFVMAKHDRFVLSKGHSAGALYVTLWTLGSLSDADLSTFACDNSLLPGHPCGRGVPGLLTGTGSLGHGPSLSVGLALAAMHRKQVHRVFCLCSDGEWQEGSCWEALTFAVHHKLNNLCIIIDQNGLQGFGRTAEVISCEDLSARIAAFGACVRKVDGHDPEAMLSAFSLATSQNPLVIILDTVKGRKLHFENTLESHYLPLTDDQYQTAYLAIQQEEMP